MFLGQWQIDDLVTFCCNTHDPATGAATDADAVPDYRVYENETSTPILTGTLALLDSSNTAGFYSEQITLSAANGFEVGKSYSIYISAAVGGVTGTLHHALQVKTAPVAVSDIPTATQNADALLKRDMSAVTGEAARSPLNAFRFLRNKWAIASGTLSVKKEDDSSEAWNASVTTTASNPTTGIDPS
jgi:hypothetical protein